MPAGCDFICQNSNCEQYKNGFVITGPWPLGQIELVISSISKTVMFKPSNKDILEKIIEQKDNGRKLARIIFPNNDNIKKVGYRIQLWSPEARCIWDYDVETNGDPLTEEVIQKANVPDKCPKTNGPLLDFTEVTKEGISCPFCGEKLQQSRWFTNE